MASIVLLHGSADTALAWRGVYRALVDHTVSAPQLPPFTASAIALDVDLPWLDAEMERTGARVLAGHSYGALLALRWALAHPGRLDKLILCEPIAWGVAAELPEFAPKLGELRHCLALFEQGDTEGALTWLVDYWNGPGFWAALPEKIRATMAAAGRRTHAEVASGEADRTSAAELATLDVPTHVLAGLRSTAESLAVARRIAATVPGAQLTEIAGAGHQFLRTHAAVVAAAIAG